MPRIDPKRCGLFSGLGCWVRLALVAAGTTSVSAEPLRLPLTCTFKAIGVGQFHGSDYAAGPVGALSTVTVAASPADLRLGRVAIIEGPRVQVAELRSGSQGITLIGQDDLATTVLSLFTATVTEGAIPAAYSRHEAIGSIPLVVQSTGVCRRPSEALDRSTEERPR